MAKFALKIDEDLVEFLTIEVDATGAPVDPNKGMFFNILRKNPTIVDITNFSYKPEFNSEWDGENFIDASMAEPKPLPNANDNTKKFAFITDGKYQLFYAVPNTETNEMIIAALSSNPKVVILGN